MADKPEMGEREFISAMFFSSDADIAAAKEKDVHQPVKRKRRKRDESLAALRKFVRVIEQVSPEARSAAIRWLAHKYLGVRL
jgi:hypothetical protein